MYMLCKNIKTSVTCSNTNIFEALRSAYIQWMLSNTFSHSDFCSSAATHLCEAQTVIPVILTLIPTEERRISTGWCRFLVVITFLAFRNSSLFPTLLISPLLSSLIVNKSELSFWLPKFDLICVLILLWIHLNLPPLCLQLRMHSLFGRDMCTLWFWFLCVYPSQFYI